jgi:hypothetical protein
LPNASQATLSEVAEELEDGGGRGAAELEDGSGHLSTSTPPDASQNAGNISEQPLLGVAHKMGPASFAPDEDEFGDSLSQALTMLAIPFVTNWVQRDSAIFWHSPLLSSQDTRDSPALEELSVPKTLSGFSGSNGLSRS